MTLSDFLVIWLLAAIVGGGLWSFFKWHRDRPELVRLVCPWCLSEVSREAERCPACEHSFVIRKAPPPGKRPGIFRVLLAAFFAVRGW